MIYLALVWFIWDIFPSCSDIFLKLITISTQKPCNRYLRLNSCQICQWFLNFFSTLSLFFSFIKLEFRQFQIFADIITSESQRNSRTKSGHKLWSIILCPLLSVFTHRKLSFPVSSYTHRESLFPLSSCILLCPISFTKKWLSFVIIYF